MEIQKGQKFKTYLFLNFIWSKLPKKDWKCEYGKYTISWHTNDYAMKDWFELEDENGNCLLDSIFDYSIIKDTTDKFVVIENVLDEDNYNVEQVNIFIQDFCEFYDKYKSTFI